ncbi:MAG: PucR family transcriptional regulator ligand-binding domain-containing protein [Firmicutes bacterium]|nr:PucR family transcriptional regulator ligand-binding domain-containing protein [Bacillota bacterium]
MEITVAEALKIGGLRHCRVVAGSRNLGNKILHIDTMEVPDIRPWLRKHELLVTTAYAIKDDTQALARLIESLAEVEAAGLAIKPGRFIGNLPDFVIEAADKLGVPLIEIPVDLPFIEITHPLMKAILSRQARRLEYSEEVHRALLRVALEGQGYDSIATTLQSLLECGVIIFNREFEVLARAGASDVVPTPDQRAHLERMSGAGRTRLGHSGWRYCCQPVRVRDRVLGYVAVCEQHKHLNSMELIALEHACTTVALEIVKQRAVDETARRLEMDFFDELLDGAVRSREVAERRAAALGWPVETSYYVVVSDVDGFESHVVSKGGEPFARAIKDRMVRTAQSALARWLGAQVGTGPAVMVRSDSLVCIVPVASDPGKNGVPAAREIMRELSGRMEGMSISVGVSHVHSEILELPVAYREAHHAAHMALVLFGGNCVTHVEDVAVFNLMMTGIDHRELGGFCNRMLGPLLEQPLSDRAVLMDTLETYVLSGGSHAETARRLFIHRNTLKYRLNKLENILGRPLTDPSYILNLGVALRLWRLLKAEALTSPSIADSL